MQTYKPLDILVLDLIKRYASADGGALSGNYAGD